MKLLVRSHVRLQKDGIDRKYDGGDDVGCDDRREHLLGLVLRGYGDEAGQLTRRR